MTAHFIRVRLDDSGATATETALVLIAFTVLIVGMIEFAVAYLTLHTIRLSLEEVGRYVMVYNDWFTTNNANTANSQAASTICTVITGSSSGCSTPSPGQSCTTTAGQFCVNATRSDTDKTMTLSATYGLNFIGLTGSSLPLGGQVTVPLY